MLILLSVTALSLPRELAQICEDVVENSHPQGLTEWIRFITYVWLRCKADELKTIVGFLDLGFVLVLIVWKIPQLQTRTIWDRQKRFSEENEARKTLLQLIGGLAVVLTLYSVIETATNAERTIQLAREAQLAERFSKATEQLGATLSGGQKNVDVRIGAIYALESIAKQSPDYHAEVMEILTAYLRNNYPWTSRCSPQPVSCSALQTQNRDDLGSYRITASADAQAIVVVLGRRETRYDSDPRKMISMVRSLDLSGTDLRGTLLARGRRNLDEADIALSNLEGVDWTGVEINGANFTGSCLAKARLWEDELEDARFDHADLTGAHLTGDISLRGAGFRETSLRCAEITGDLTGADLTGAHLEGARFKFKDQQATVSAEQIKVACIDEATVLPDNAIRKPRMTGSCR